MISISKFLTAENETGHSLLNAVRFLVRGIGLHAAEGNAEDRAVFRERMHQISDEIADEIAPEDLMAHAGEVLDAIEDHSRRAVGELRLQVSELQDMVKSLTSSVLAMSCGAETSAAQLRAIEERIGRARGTEITKIRSRLAECLREIEKETELQQKETAETIDALGRNLEEALRLANDGSGTRDAVTGLPARPEAELALAQSGRSGEKTYAAVVVLDRLEAINLRFGKQVGDTVLSEFAHSIQRDLCEGDRLFRWSATALMALMPRQTALEITRNEVARIVENKIEQIVQTVSRTILLPISARWTVYPMMAAPRLIYKKLDSFAALSAAQD